jgi:hypothetical protein
MTDTTLRRASEALCLAGSGSPATSRTSTTRACIQSARSRMPRDRADLALLSPRLRTGRPHRPDLILVFVSPRSRGERALLAGSPLNLVAFAFSVYLTYREIFTIPRSATGRVERDRLHLTGYRRDQAGAPSRRRPTGRANNSVSLLTTA